MATTSDYNYPVFGTQGGGLARQSGNRFIFVEAPNCPGLDIGDLVPEQWGIVPANLAAQEAVNLAEFDDEEWKDDSDAALKDYGLKGM